MSDYIECPKCGKKSVVQRKEDLYQCISCDFKRDFAKSTQSKSDKGIIWLGFIAVISAFYMLLARESFFNTPRFESQSAPVSSLEPTTVQARTGQ